MKTTHPEGERTSMYSELLAVSLRDASPAPTPPAAAEETPRDALLAELEACRRRLHRDLQEGEQQRAGARLDVLHGIARQIDYDLALMKLCRAYGIDCDPSAFARPLTARRQLEALLRGAGVPLLGG